MTNEIAPFGGYVDSNIERALAWFLEFIGASDWQRRVERVEHSLETLHEAPTSQNGPQMLQSVSVPDDRIAWYLYLADALLHEPLKYEAAQGARVIPIFKMIGAELDILAGIPGVERRVTRLLTSGRNQPDGALFELLVALLWRRNGWESVELLDESPPAKRPDIRAEKGSEECFIECKRLQERSDYSNGERQKWLRMWQTLSDLLVHRRMSVIFDIVFHVELDTLPDDFLLDELQGKLQLVQLPCKLASNDMWDVTARPVDYDSVRAHLAAYRVKYPSDQINELIGGSRNPNLGFTASIEGRFVRMGKGGANNRFLDDLHFATAAYWSCDAERAIEHKARDIRGHLARAILQLPASSPGVVHIVIETVDGAIVEKERYGRIMNTLYKFDARGKNLQSVYCHLLQSYSPPSEPWVFDETVYKFLRSKGVDVEALTNSSAVVPESEFSEEGFHWLRKPP